MRSRSPRCTTPPTAVSLRRWLCTWLALLIVAQTAGAALAGRHRHHHAPSLRTSAPATPVVHWRHGDATRDEHAQWHATGQLHEHALTDPSVLPLSADTASEAVAQLAATLAPGAEATGLIHDGARHVQADAAAWAPTSRAIAPLLKPPRG